MPGYYEPTEPSYTYDDYRAERDAEEGAREHDFPGEGFEEDCDDPIQSIEWL